MAMQAMAQSRGKKVEVIAQVDVDFVAASPRPTAMQMSITWHRGRCFAMSAITWLGKQAFEEQVLLVFPDPAAEAATPAIAEFFLFLFACSLVEVLRVRRPSALLLSGAPAGQSQSDFSWSMGACKISVVG